MITLLLKSKSLYLRVDTNITIRIVSVLIIQFISTLVYADILTGVTDLTFSSQSRYSCAIINHDTAKCWGANWAGQIGDGTTTNRFYPVDVFGLKNITSLTTGGHHTCALLSDHSLKCWGNNSKGQLGDGTNVNKLIPTAISELGNQVVAVAAGTSHTCAVVKNEVDQQIVKCWGDNGQGQLGDNSFTNRKSPVATVSLNANAVAIAAGNQHSCVILENSTVKCWGGNNDGQLGNGDTTNKSFPVTVSDLTNVKSIITGESHTCAKLIDNTMSCWGLNDRGQLGIGDTMNRTIPSPITALADQVELVATGRSHVCVTVFNQNSLKCWGENDLGQLGIGSTDDALEPSPIMLTEKINKISLGYNHSCALTDDNRMYCWGGNGGGQLGDGTTRFRTLPIPVLTTYPDILLKMDNNEVNQNDIIDFGSIGVNNSLSKIFVIENTGIDALHLKTPLTLNNDEFIITKQPDSFIAGGTSTTLVVKFAPSNVGDANDTITITSNDSDESSYSFTVKGSSVDLSCSPPMQPTQFIAKAISPAIIDLTWQDDSSDETHFTIYRDGVLLDTVAANTTSFHDSNLSENTTYYYEISAKNDSCASTIVETTITTPLIPKSGGTDDDEEDEEENDLPPDDNSKDDSINENHAHLSNSYQLPKELSIFVTLGGSGSGSVISKPLGINCQQSGETCRHFFKTGTIVELTPIADISSTFVGWGGHTDCADSRLFLTGNRLCTAYFRKIEAQPAITKNTIPVYRLWSYYWKKHFHTANAYEKQNALVQPDYWRDEDVAFYAFSQTDHPANTLPVYRFWSEQWSSHFYTIHQEEKALLIQDFADEWRYEGIAYYAYPAGKQPVDAIPVYRLFSFILQEHFYTANEEEKLMIEQRCSAANWRYEGVGWYVAR